MEAAPPTHMLEQELMAVNIPLTWKMSNELTQITVILDSTTKAYMKVYSERRWHCMIMKSSIFAQEPTAWLLQAPRA